MRRLPTARSIWKVIFATTALLDIHFIALCLRKADGVANVRVHVAAGAARGSHPIRFEITDMETGEAATSASAFFAGNAP